MLSWTFEKLGGLVGDTVEGIKYLGDEVSEIPAAIEKGFSQGCIYTPESGEDGVDQPTDTVPAQPSIEQLEEMLAKAKANRDGDE